MPTIRTRHLRIMHRSDGYLTAREATVIDVPASEVTRIANCRSLAAEANAENLFGGQIDWVLVSLICREMLEAHDA